MERGQIDRGLAILTAVASDTHAPLELRTEALREAARGALNAERPSDLVMLCRSWLELDPSSSLAAWTLIGALVDLGLVDEAAASYDDLQPEATTQWENRTAATFFAAALEPRQAAERIVAMTADAQAVDPAIARILNELGDSGLDNRR